MNLLDRLLSYTKANNGCLEWIRCYNTDGYPRININGNTNTKVHRLVYELFNNENIDGLVVRHTCDNPKCINPNHLVKGTPEDNMLDRHIRFRTHNQISMREIDVVFNSKLQGLTTTEIAKNMGVSERRVRYIMNKKANLFAGG